MGNAVTVELSPDEALVLFEWLARLDEAKFAVGEAEKRVLWRIEGVHRYDARARRGAQAVEAATSIAVEA